MMALMSDRASFSHAAAGVRSIASCSLYIILLGACVLERADVFNVNTDILLDSRFDRQGETHVADGS